MDKNTRKYYQKSLNITGQCSTVHGRSHFQGSVEMRGH